MCHVRVPLLSVGIVDLETPGKTSDLVEADARGPLHLRDCMRTSVRQDHLTDVRGGRDLCHRHRPLCFLVLR